VKPIAICAAIALAFVLIASDADARGGGRGGRVHYGGGHHTTSHHGKYIGGVGPSHKGGTYSNPTTADQYGTHK
jgi:hypothetical protein